MSMLLWTALLLGVVGSLHCVGMCGPIALALPIAHMSKAFRIRGILAYNFGRAATYSVLGAFSGLIGGAINWAGGQQALSIVAGVVILVALFLAFTGKRFPFAKRFDRFFNGVRRTLGSLFRQRTIKGLLLIGLLNGLLPCGLVFAALGGAAATGAVLQGAAFMFVFGLGTIPAMFSLSIAAVHVSDRLRKKLHRAVPIFVTAMALLLILRGMGLGIPYVSPSYVQDNPVCCHR